MSFLGVGCRVNINIMSIVKNEVGGLNILLIPLILTVLGFFGALGFGTWAYIERDDYKNNADEKIAAAVQVAEDRVSSEKDNEFVELEKNPFRNYEGPAVFGGITFKYPKTWSGYIEEDDNKMKLLLNPGLVTAGAKTKHALRVEVVGSSYDSELKDFDGKIKNGKVKAKAFRLEKLNDVLGARLDGEVGNGINGAMVLLPLRDKTIRISTESEEYVKDFNEIILPDFRFNP